MYMKKIFLNWTRLWPFAFYGFCVCLLIALIVPVFSSVPDAADPGLSATDLAAPDPENPDFTDRIFEFAEENPEPSPGPVLVLENPALFLNMHQDKDFILEAYHDAALHDMVAAFFGQICGSRELASIILDYAAEYEISPSLAFSLCWEESRYNPKALNTKNRNLTRDRGLFQLNDASFPNLTEKDFFDPKTNTRYGLGHLRWCLDFAGTEVAGLAMYNAGTNRVRTGGTPKNTLDYVSRIINRQRKIDELFIIEYSRPVEYREIPVPEKHAPVFILSLLAPLGAR